MRRATPILLFALLCAGCGTRNATVPTPQVQAKQILNQIDAALNGVASATLTVERDVMRMYPDNTEERRAILDIIYKIAMYNETARTVVVQLSISDLTTPQGIHDAIMPLFTRLRKLLDDGLAGFKSPEARAQAETAINLAEIAVNRVVAILAGIGASQ